DRHGSALFLLNTRKSSSNSRPLLLRTLTDLPHKKSGSFEPVSLAGSVRGPRTWLLLHPGGAVRDRACTAGSAGFDDVQAVGPVDVVPDEQVVRGGSRATRSAVQFELDGVRIGIDA